jgi:hypothetical protein
MTPGESMNEDLSVILVEVEVEVEVGESSGFSGFSLSGFRIPRWRVMKHGSLQD